MKILLMWSKSKYGGWLLNKIAMQISDSIVTIEEVIEELQPKFFTLLFVREYLQDDLNELINEYNDDYKEEIESPFVLDKVEYRDYVICFDFKNDTGVVLTIEKDSNDIIKVITN